MGSPQKENGYTAIANEIMEALAKYRIPGEQRQCLDFILRKTYGFNKKSDMISLSQFCNATGLKKPNVSRALKELNLKNIIVITFDNKIAKTYRFNKRYTSWKPLSKKIIVIKKDNKSLSKVSTTKVDNTKDILFGRFWNLYNKKQDRDKSYKKFVKLPQKEIDLIFQTLPAYIKSTPDPQYRKNPLTYLNGKCWKDEQYQAPQKKKVYTTL